MYLKCETNLSQSRRLPLLQVVSNNKSFSVGVQSPTEINAPRGCAVILRRICQLSLTRITHQVSRAFDLNYQDARYRGHTQQWCGRRRTDRLWQCSPDICVSIPSDRRYNHWEPVLCVQRMRWSPARSGTSPCGSAHDADGSGFQNDRLPAFPDRWGNQWHGGCWHRFHTTERQRCSSQWIRSAAI